MFALRSILLGSILMLASKGYAGEHLIVNTGFTPPVSTVFNRILTHATQKMGVTLEFHEMSGERALALADQGVADGECCRIPEIVLREYKNLLPVSEGVFQVNFSAFTKQPNVVINRWEDLKPYSVGTVTGWKILVQNMQKVAPRESIVLDTPDSLFRMLDQDRVEIALLGELSGLDVLTRLDIKGVKTLNPPLASHTLYLMLNKRHANLVPKFTETLKAMHADGTVKRIVDEVMNAK